MKAYVCSDISNEARTYIVFADNSEEAQVMLVRAEGCETTNFYISREPQLDKYCDKPIPAWVLLGLGWFLICQKCGGEVYDDDRDTVIYKDDGAYCADCGAKLRFSEEFILRKTPLKKVVAGDKKSLDKV